MSPESLTNKKESGTNRKAATTTTTPAEVVVEAPKCPRCDSSNTKFCYYNNYSLTQPRHFCKACKRYWTKGGALRNIPVGGGCRKNKKITTKFSNFSRFISSISPRDHDHFKYLATTTTNSSALCLNNNNNLPSIFHNSLSNNQQYDQFSSFGTNNDLMGMDISPFPLSSSSSSFIHDKQDHANGLYFLHDHNIATNISSYNVAAASSIESLSCINQDLHWKLQQERLAMLFDDKKQEDSSKQDTNEWFFNGNAKSYSSAINLSNDPSSSTSNGVAVAWCNLYQ